MEEKDTYKTLVKPSEETLFKDRNSKFFGYAFPVNSEEAIKECLEDLRKLHPSAGHHCYAWQLGTDDIRFRANDDGEPSNSAGQPIYGQIQAFDITNVLIVSVRYFGGTKLGVGGLINAYRTSAKLALEASEIIEKTINFQYKVTFGYDMMNKVQQVIKKNQLEIIDQKLELDCEYIVSVRKKEADTVQKMFESIFKVTINQI
ncbi:putative YigZ family protein [Tenacibaculum skagerrakense]|uniref:Putative YigZ family protein n=1 Tax=Tenacibaculum skagerrakense TaxID=186571 RepID=A0A4R2NV34_9FLAO|nr:YigZ family protein [Tenacibaculum skagerrakense]TCP25822.1 putative YigZ family protein [Tenacibaculum skagerrakense]